MRKGFTLIELMIVVAIIAIIAAIAIPSLLRSRMAANEASAIGGLKQLTSHEASLRQTDGDGNGIKDHWTIDVAGFYALQDVKGVELKYIDVQMAKADDNAQQAYAWTTSAVGSGVLKSGYLYRALLTDENQANYVDATLTNNPKLAKPCTNRTKFGFIAYPGVYGRGGVRILIISEEGVIYGCDNGEHSTATPKADYSGLGATADDEWPGVDPTSVTAGGGRVWAASD